MYAYQHLMSRRRRININNATTYKMIPLTMQTNYDITPPSRKKTFNVLIRKKEIQLQISQCILLLRDDD